MAHIKSKPATITSRVLQGLRRGYKNSIIKNFNSILKLQYNVDNVSKWSSEWSTELNAENCKVLHIGYTNKYFDYDILTDGKSRKREDIGVYINDDFKWDVQVRNYATKTNRVLGMIRKTFKYTDKNIMKLLYTPLVRPHPQHILRKTVTNSKKSKKEQQSWSIN
ncbi:unnamed protein product [Brachionus calyciflorus]|uniref:Uncharacterized protein n=1 Tax=Brachionus calyciflorus TaxID=104777 RepID=A0A814QMF8_9BILA|nr:unnamed protein product [Brachionus calyciflorus]